jgi:riboflavin kinase / FMN adenylyltransferase
VRVVAWTDLLAGREKIREPVRLAIGVFDGLHIGHRALMEAIVAGPRSGKALVVTFTRNPQQFLAPSRFPGFILSYRQKLSRLADLGVEAVVAIDFSDEMSNLTGRAFIGLLRDNLNIEKIVVGENFRFGRSREAGPGDLRAMLFGSGIEVQVSHPVLRDNAVVSSSRVRKTIQEADFAEARCMLLADHSLDVSGVAGTSRAEGVTAYRRSDIEQVLPRPDRYEVDCEHAAGRSEAELEVFSDVILLKTNGREKITTVTFH